MRVINIIFSFSSTIKPFKPLSSVRTLYVGLGKTALAFHWTSRGADLGAGGALSVGRSAGANWRGRC